MYTKSMIRQDIKARAKTALSGNWFIACLIMLIQLLMGFGFTALQSTFIKTLDMGTFNIYGEIYDYSAVVISPVISLLSFFILVPLNFGIVSWYMAIALGKKESIGNIFGWFESAKKYWKSLGVMISLTLRSILYMLPIYVVFVGGFVALLLTGAYDSAQYGYVSGSLDMLYVVLGVVLLLVFAGCLILYSIFMMRYSVVTYLAVKDPDRKINELFRSSIAMMKGHKRELFVFSLSFIAWFLLLPVTCGLILFFLVPYMATATAMFAFYVIDSYQKKNGLAPIFGDDDAEDDFIPVSFAGQREQQENETFDQNKNNRLEEKNEDDKGQKTDGNSANTWGGSPEIPPQPKPWNESDHSSEGDNKF